MGLDGLRCVSSFGDDWASLSMGLTSGSLSSLVECFSFVLRFLACTLIDGCGDGITARGGLRTTGTYLRRNFLFLSVIQPEPSTLMTY